MQLKSNLGLYSLTVRTAGRTGIMFLNEVALGKEHTITNNDCSLTKAPPGYDCIVARGRTEPSKSFSSFSFLRRITREINQHDRIL